MVTRRHLAILIASAGCDPSIEHLDSEERGVWIGPRKPVGALCEEEQPITSDDYCPTGIVRSCLIPQAIPAIGGDEINPAPPPGTIGNIDEFVNALNTDYDACMASDRCLAPGLGFLEHSCCSAEMHWGWLQARKTCFSYYGVGVLYYSDGPCRRQALDLECQSQCWIDHADCYREGNFSPVGVCTNAMIECYETCRDSYGSAIPGQPWWNYPGPWNANEYGG